MPRRINYKSRIITVLQIEHVAYAMEIAGRIDVYRHRTIKFVLKEMREDGEIERSNIERINGNIKIAFYWLPNTDEYTISRVGDFKKYLLASISQKFLEKAFHDTI